ncbi:Acetyltransferase (GNAT) family protein [Bacillus sp. 491mf]|nr:Acetyltransferase (GNAT) family protein [Bacillus sp. 491mf]
MQRRKHSIEFKQQVVQEAIETGNKALVANNHILGFASLYLLENFIHNLFVYPDFSGKGVGRKLLSASIEKMNKLLRLKCVSENKKAMKFHENKGWKKVIEEREPGERYWLWYMNREREFLGKKRIIFLGLCFSVLLVVFLYPKGYSGKFVQWGGDNVHSVNTDILETNHIPYEIKDNKVYIPEDAFDRAIWCCS